MEGKFGLPPVVNRIETGTVENITENVAYNDTTAQETVSFSFTTLFFTTSPLSSKSFTGEGSRNTFQFYLIGVYAFFVALFLLGILIIIATKLYKACCTTYDDEYDSPSRGILVCQDDSVSEHHVNVDSSDLQRTHQEQDSDYENYSDVSNDDKNHLREKPPDYEEPPSYSALFQTQINVG